MILFWMASPNAGSQDTIPGLVMGNQRAASHEHCSRASRVSTRELEHEQTGVFLGQARVEHEHQVVEHGSSS